MALMVRILTFAAALMPAIALAQNAPRDYPNRTVRIVVPFAPAGPTDILARVVAQKLSDRLGKQFIVENMPGAGSNIGINHVARAAPDGHTLLMVSSSLVINPGLYAKPPFDPTKDLAPITLAASSPQALLVNPATPAKTVKEVFAYIKAHPDKANFASPSAGTNGHLSGELLKLSSGLDLVHVPFNGAGPMLAALIGGHATMGFAALPPAAGFIKDGTLRPLAVSSAKRSTAFPDIPTLEEAGFPDQIGEVMQGVLAPAGTPKPIVEYLQREIAVIVALPDVRAKLAVMGFEPVANTPEEFTAMIKAEVVKWTKVVRDAKITPL